MNWPLRWWRDRRGYGPLHIPHHRRALNRAHPVAQRLRAGRTAMLRRHWRGLLVVAALYLTVCACLVLPAPGRVQWQGFTVGVCAGALLTLVAGMLLLLDGSLLRRIGRSIEADVGDELRRAHRKHGVDGLYGVVSSVWFDGCDVDHLLLAPSGVWVVEVKWSMSPADDLDHVWHLGADLAQVRTGARKVTGLLRGVAPGVPVRPLLVLAGPGMPDVATGEMREGVRIVPSMAAKDWAAFLATEAGAWPLEQARAAAQLLMAFRDRRLAYERRRLRETSVMSPASSTGPARRSVSRAAPSPGTSGEGRVGGGAHQLRDGVGVQDHPRAPRGCPLRRVGRACGKAVRSGSSRSTT